MTACCVERDYQNPNWQITLVAWQFPLSGQLQLGDVGATLDVIFLFWFLIIFAMLSMQLQLTLIVFLFSILCSLFERGKCLSMRCKNLFPMLADTFLL